MRRPTRHELDQAIIDAAALLFARHGYSHTSVQQIADEVGYSKTGLLHRFPSKEALRQAVADQFAAELQTLVTAVHDQPPGPARDLAVIQSLADLAQRRRGTTALMVSALTAQRTPGDLAWLHGVAAALFDAFGMDDASSDPGRFVRIVGALGAVAVIALATADLPGSDIRDLIVATGVNALGHPAPVTAGGDADTPGTGPGTRQPRPRAGARTTAASPLSTRRA
jgi:AcrR family transcriptional regulator